jgi:hypothetical protein
MGGDILLKLETGQWPTSLKEEEETEFTSENRGTAYLFIISLLCLLRALHKLSKIYDFNNFLYITHVIWEPG